VLHNSVSASLSKADLMVISDKFGITASHRTFDIKDNSSCNNGMKEPCKTGLGDGQ
jgi:hypothetical protein